MKVRVNFFSFANLAGIRESVIELPPRATMDDLAHLLAEQFPKLFPAADTAMYLVNHRSASRETPLSEGDQVIMLQVVGGG